MKLFAIITAGLMSAAGGVYFFSTSYSNCSKSACSAPVAKTGGCCALETATHDCCATQEECCLIPEACCAVVSQVSTKVSTKSACCAAQDECCIVLAACCAAEKVSAVAKPIEIKGCCEEACVKPAQTVSAAAASIATVK